MFTEQIVKLAAKVRLTEEEVSTLRGEFEGITNTFGFDPSKHVEELLTKEAERRFLSDLAVTWVKYWTSDRRLWIDGRNEFSVMMCKKIAQTEMFQNPDLAGSYAAHQVVEDIAMYTHRTLAQTIAEIMFYIIKCISPETDAAMTAEYGSKWYRMPLV